MPLSTGQVLNQRYRIVRLLGQGGFGAVYRAWDLNLKRPCALKENLDTSPEARSQFEHEALILARLDHPNLARVSDHFFIEGQGQYLVMYYVEGEDLQEVLEKRESPLPVANIIRWIAQICDALDYMHNQEPAIIHRDIKPANIKITPQGKAMLVDFGIAKVYDPQLVTTVGARAITPGYSPPEQYGMGKTDARSDIYSLAATTYSLLTGRVPPDAVDILTGSQAPPTLVSKLNDAVSLELSKVIARGMDVNRDARYSSVSSYKSDLLEASEQRQQGGVAFVTEVVGESIISPMQPAIHEAARETALDEEPDATSVMAKVSSHGMDQETTSSKAAQEDLNGEVRAEMREEPQEVADKIARTVAPEIVPQVDQKAQPHESALKTVVVPHPEVEESLELTKRRRWPLVAGIVGAVIVVVALAIGVWILSDDGSLSDLISPSTGGEPEPGGAAMEIQADLTLWHTHEQGTHEEEALKLVSELVSERFPGVSLELSHLPPEEIGESYAELVTSGGGPDIVLWGNSDIVPWVYSELVLPLSDHADLDLDLYHPMAIQSFTVEGRVYGLPLNAWILGLYYNLTMVDSPPLDFPSLKEQVANGVGFSAPVDAYYLYGSFGMVGAQVLDDRGRCVADRTGGVLALMQLRELQELGAVIVPENEVAEQLFMQGEVGMNINGPWVLEMYRERWGDQLRVAPLPESQLGRYNPLLSVDGFIINPKSKYLEEAVEVVKFLTGPEAGQIYSEIALKVPVRWDIEPAGPILRKFFEIMAFGDISMRRLEFASYWDPFNEMFFAVLENEADPRVALGDACAWMNEMNGK